MLLKIDNLSVSINNKKILNNLNLTINEGEIHVIMGPNGSGKSTLSKTIMGYPYYKSNNGNLYFKDIDIIKLKTDERARLGIFLGMQLPLEIEGVSNFNFLRTILSIKEDKKLDLSSFIKKIETEINNLKIDDKMIYRSINEGFSGGERKKNEILQMKLLEPYLIILDEIDSGLDIDSLKIVADNIIDYKKKYPEVGILIITHYSRILQYIKPNYVHIMTCGKIVKTGDYQLALDIDNQGYNNIELNVVGEIYNDK